MKKKLKELITSPTTTRRLGDFICNFTAVVLGIIITFIGSDMIQEHNKKKEVTQALQLVKSELLINKEIIEDMKELEIFNKQGVERVPEKHGADGICEKSDRFPKGA